MNSLRIEGQQTVAMEIVQQFGWEVPDWVIVPAGNLGNISAMYKGFQLMRTLGVIDGMPRLVAAQAEKANPLYRNFLNGFVGYEPVTAKTTLASAIQIGNPVSYDKAVQAIRKSDGLVVSVTEHELANAAALADRSGMYTCPHTGVALAALMQLVEQKQIQRHDRAVVVSTAHGLKFTKFKADYHLAGLEEVESTLANPLRELPASVDVVKEEIHRILNTAGGY
jgi:threonine synthase